MERLAAKTVLILEDEPLIALDLEFVAHEAGFGTTVEFTTLSAAENWLEDHTPDLGILDIQFSDGDALNIGRVLEKRNIPFLIYSALSKSLEAPDKVLDAGKWLPKPCPPELLISTIHQTMHVVPAPHRRRSCRICDCLIRLSGHFWNMASWSICLWVDASQLRPASSICSDRRSMSHSKMRLHANLDLWPQLSH
ncbi:MAG: Response regulator receiver domain protein [Rhizobium sp.]|nr:Response regulator receiver domain protein [Rhizobium sp.]